MREYYANEPVLKTRLQQKNRRQKITMRKKHDFLIKGVKIKSFF